MPRVIAIVFYCALVAACSTISAPPINLVIDTNNSINPGNDKRPLPVNVIVYQLNRIEPFHQASFDELWQDDGGVLGDSLKAKHTISLLPNRQKRLALPYADGARYVAVMGVFRRPHASKWQTSIVLPNAVQRSVTSLKLTVKGSEVALR